MAGAWEASLTLAPHSPHFKQVFRSTLKPHLYTPISGPQGIVPFPEKEGWQWPRSGTLRKSPLVAWTQHPLFWSSLPLPDRQPPGLALSKGKPQRPFRECCLGVGGRQGIEVIRDSGVSPGQGSPPPPGTTKTPQGRTVCVLWRLQSVEGPPYLSSSPWAAPGPKVGLCSVPSPLPGKSLLQGLGVGACTKPQAREAVRVRVRPAADPPAGPAVFGCAPDQARLHGQWWGSPSLQASDVRLDPQTHRSALVSVGQAGAARDHPLVP